MPTNDKTTKTTCASATESCEMRETAREKRTDVWHCIPNQPFPREKANTSNKSLKQSGLVRVKFTEERAGWQ